MVYLYSTIKMMHGPINLRVLEFERESTKSHNLENSLWKSLRTCHKTHYTREQLQSITLMSN